MLVSVGSFAIVAVIPVLGGSCAKNLLLLGEPHSSAYNSDALEGPRGRCRDCDVYSSVDSVVREAEARSYGHRSPGQ